MLTILQTIAIGFFASVGLGPVTILVLNRGISSGFKSAFVSGLGCAIVDTFYGSLAFVGAGLVLVFLEDFEGIIRIVIMVLLFGISYFLWMSKAKTEVPDSKRNSKIMAGNVLSTFGLALSNPFLILVYLSIFSLFPMASIEADIANLPLISVGLLVGTVSWWLLISFSSSRFKSKLPLFFSRNLNRISSILLLCLGIYSGITGIIFLFGSI